MITKPQIEELRYVNGLPDTTARPDQQRITWIKNGEAITGASGDTVSDGILNRPTVSIQENVVTTQNNIKAHQTTIESLVTTVNDLTGGGDADLGARVSTLETSSSTHTTQIAEHTSRIGQDGTIAGQSKTGLYRSIDTVNSALGTRSPLDVKNPSVVDDSARSDLWWIKNTIIGNKRNYDPNGNFNEVLYPLSSGMQSELERHSNEIAQSTLTVSALDARVASIEDNTEVGAVTDLREDLGLRTDAGYDANRTVFARLKGTEDTNNSQQLKIDSLDTAVFSAGGVVDDIVVLQSQQSATNISLTTVNQNIASVNSDIGTWSTLSGAVKTNIETNKGQITALWADLGTGAWASQTSSVKYRLNEVTIDIGVKATDTQASGTIWGYVNKYLKGTTTGSILNHETRLTSLETGGTNYNPRITYLEGAIGTSGGAYGDGFTLKDAGKIKALFADGATNPVITVLESSHSNGVIFGAALYPAKMIGSTLTFNGTPVVTTNGATFTGSVKGITPTVSADFATKGYTDSTFASLLGATFTGIVKGITPVADADLTTKGYVTTAIAAAPYLPTGANINIGDYKVSFGTLGGIQFNNANGSTASVKRDSTSVSLRYETATASEARELKVDATGLKYVEGTTTYNVYSEANKPTPVALGVPAITAVDGVGYIQKDGAWATAPIQSDAASDGTKYGRLNGAWAAIKEGLYLTKVVQVTAVADFGNVTTDTIVLANNTTYLIAGTINIGARRFVNDLTTSATNYNCAIRGLNPLTDKLVSTSVLPLFRGHNIGLRLEEFGITTNGTLFDLTNDAFSFVTIRSVNVDSAVGLGSVSDLNEFEWNGHSFISFLTGTATTCPLKFIGACDIVRLDGLAPHSWDGSLFDFSLANAQTINICDIDVKISAATQSLLSSGSDDTSLSATGFGRITNCNFRRHHTLGTLTDQEFTSMVRAGTLLGGVTSNSDRWEISGGTNVRTSEIYAVISKTAKQSVTFTNVYQPLFGTTGILTGENVKSSHFAYSNGVLTSSGINYGTKTLSLDWNLLGAAIVNEFTLGIKVEVTDVNANVTTSTVTRVIPVGQLQSTNIRLPLLFGNTDTIKISAVIDTGGTTFTLDSYGCVLSIL